MKIVALVCPNGLGHYRRVTDILDRLLAKIPDLTADIVCAEWQTREPGFKTPSGTDRKSRVRFHHGIVDPGVHWSPDPAVYDDGRLMSWLPRAAQLKELESAKVVLCDNMAGILSLRPDAVLSGSFLWSDVLSAAYPDHSAVAEFVRHERDLLARCGPEMICVKEVVMPAVEQHTRAVPLDWMCSERLIVSRPADSPKQRIALAGGATGTMDRLLCDVARILAGSEAWIVALPRKLIAQNGLEKIRQIVPFGFTPAEYLQCHVVMGRPGVGTLTDCITYGIPFIAFHEPNNIEMAHLGQRVRDLGMGQYLGDHPSLEQIIAAIRAVSAHENTAVIRARMLQFPRLGLEQAAEWLATRLKNKA